MWNATKPACVTTLQSSSRRQKRETKKAKIRKPRVRASGFGGSRPSFWIFCVSARPAFSETLQLLGGKLSKRITPKRTSQTEKVVANELQILPRDPVTSFDCLGVAESTRTLAGAESRVVLSPKVSVVRRGKSAFVCTQPRDGWRPEICKKKRKMYTLHYCTRNTLIPPEKRTIPLDVI